MQEYKAIITKSEEKINEVISQGWSIDSITAQHVATGSIATSKDEFAIGFAEWVLDRLTFKDFIHKEPKELLEIYKKEKGL